MGLLHLLSSLTSLRQRAVMVALLVPLLGLTGTTLAQDLDGDGWSVADGDLCDEPSGQCTSPELVNPGAYDIPDNGIDDDCDGTIDNPTPLNCSTTPNFGAVDGLELAKAMDICQLTPSDPPLPQRTWGLISAEVLRGDGSGSPPSPLQVAVVTGFGDSMVPQANATMAVLSSGTARDADDPGYVAPAEGFSDPSNMTFPPAEFTSAYGGDLFNAPGCPVVSGDGVVYDLALLRLNIRVPTNADGLSLDLMFLTSQFPDLCTEYNDHVLALLYTGAVVPADHNIVFNAYGYPMTTQTAPFVICNLALNPNCVFGYSALTGTGFDPLDDAATGWLADTYPIPVAPVIPGEEITLDLYIFDVQDALWDSTVLLDDLHWRFIPQDDVSAAEDTAPTPSFRLLRPMPNPFNPTTEITFFAPSGQQTTVTVHDLRGREIALLFDGQANGGSQSLTWNATGLASGVYFVRVISGNETATEKIALLK